MVFFVWFVRVVNMPIFNCKYLEYNPKHALFGGVPSELVLGIDHKGKHLMCD